MNLIEEFDSINKETVQRFISEKQEENLTLDFKNINSSDMEKDDRKNYAKALSGFANSSGGLIVWGVDARKDEQNIDCAVGLKPVTGLKRFLTRLNELESKAADPIIQGIRHKIIPMANEDSGVGITYVPASDMGPHMAKLTEDRYYKRSGSTFYKMEHFDLADMFGKRKRPVLRLSYQEKGGLGILVSIENVGRGSAFAPFVEIEPLPSGIVVSQYGIDGNHNTNISRIFPFDKIKYGAGMNYAIHPGTSIALLILAGPSSKDPPARFEIGYRISAADYGLEKGRLLISREHSR